MLAPRTLAAGMFACGALLMVIGNLDLLDRCREGCGFSSTDYASLYVPEEAPRIEGLEQLDDATLRLRLVPAPARRWQVTSEAGRSYEVEGPHPVLRLMEGVHRYELTSMAASDSATTRAPQPFRFSVTVTYAPGSQQPGSAGAEATYFVSNASLPLGRFPRYSMNKLALNTTHFPETHVREARALLTAAGLDSEDPTPVRIEKLMAFLMEGLDAHRGTPTLAALGMPPLQQYHSALAGEIELWCGNFATIYGFFASVAGIPTRLVTAKGNLDGVPLSGHTFAESYVAEARQWAYVDPTFRTAYMRDSRGNYLNAVQVTRMLESRSDAKVLARLVQDGSIRTGRDPEEERFMRLHLHPNSTLIYHWPYEDRSALLSRLHRYVVEPELAYVANPHQAGGRTLVSTLGEWLLIASAAFGLGSAYTWWQSRRRAHGAVATPVEG